MCSDERTRPCEQMNKQNEKEPVTWFYTIPSVKHKPGSASFLCLFCVSGQLVTS